MKGIAVTVLLWVTMNSLYGQYGDIYLGNWLIFRVESLDSIPLKNDFYYFRLEMFDNAVIRLYYGNILSENNASYLERNYSIVDGKLSINTDPSLEFNVEIDSNKHLILTRHEKRYCFEKLLIGTKGNSISTVATNDTVQFYLSPNFKGDFIKYFTLDNNSVKNKDSSFLFYVSFILRSDGLIDSITINNSESDSLLAQEVINLVKASEKQWNVSRSLNYKKKDDNINIFVLVKSPRLQKLTSANKVRIVPALYEQALILHTNNSLLSAEDYYTDVINTDGFLYYNKFYIHLIYPYEIIESLNNALINRAAIRIQLGRIYEACDDFKSVTGDVDVVNEVSEYINSYCQ